MADHPGREAVPEKMCTHTSTWANASMGKGSADDLTDASWPSETFMRGPNSQKDLSGSAIAAVLLQVVSKRLTYV